MAERLNRDNKAPALSSRAQHNTNTNTNTEPKQQGQALTGVR